MRGKQFYYFLITIFLIVLVLAGFGFYYAVFENLEQENQAPSSGQNPAAPEADDQSPHVRLLFADGKLLVAWDHLPADAKSLEILRGQKNGGIMTKWKSIILPNLDDSSVQIGSGGLADFGKYDYRVEIHSGSAAIFSSGLEVVTSTAPQTAGTNPPPSAEPGNTPSSGAGSGQAGSLPASALPASQTGSHSGQTSSSAQTPPPPAGQNTSGGQTSQSSGSGSGSPAPNFWVSAVNQKIEIGWQNLPTGTNLAILSRSKTASGPWSQILKQTNPVTDSPYKIYLVDQGLNESFYYRLQVYSSQQLTAAYGPVYLAAQ